MVKNAIMINPDWTSIRGTRAAESAVTLPSIIIINNHIKITKCIFVSLSLCPFLPLLRIKQQEKKNTYIEVLNKNHKHEDPSLQY